MLASVLGLLLRVFISQVETSRRLGKSRLWSLLEATVIVVLMPALPFLISICYRDSLSRPEFASGVQLGISVIVGFIVLYLGSMFIVFLTRRKPESPPADQPSEESLLNLPTAARSSRAVVVVLVLGCASAIAAWFGGGGSAAGYVIAFCLSPLAWIAFSYLLFLKSHKCPNCGRLIPVSDKEEPVGSLLWCRCCCKYSRKSPA